MSEFSKFSYLSRGQIAQSHQNLRCSNIQSTAVDENSDQNLDHLENLGYVSMGVYWRPLRIWDQYHYVLAHLNRDI